LFFLPDRTKSHLTDMGDRVDREMAQSRRGANLKQRPLGRLITSNGQIS
jgi:hypothetical protein